MNIGFMHDDFTIIFSENGTQLTSMSPHCNGPPESVGKMSVIRDSSL